MMVSSPGVKRRARLLIVACVAAGAASAQAVRAARSHYVTVAEALTSPSLGEAMSVTPRMLGPFQLNEACQTPHRIARLEAPARTVDLRVGEGLSLSTLRVVAVGESGRAVPAVPVAIDAEERYPPVVQLRSDDPNLNAGRLVPVASGAFRMRVRTLCAAAPREMVITGRVAS